MMKPVSQFDNSYDNSYVRGTMHSAQDVPRCCQLREDVVLTLKHEQSLDIRDRCPKLPFVVSFSHVLTEEKCAAFVIKKASVKHSSLICLTQVILAQIRVKGNEVQSLEKRDKKRAIMKTCQFHHAESSIRYILKVNPASLACRFSLLCINIKLLLTFFFCNVNYYYCCLANNSAFSELLDNVNLWLKRSTLRVKGDIF